MMHSSYVSNDSIKRDLGGFTTPNKKAQGTYIKKYSTSSPMSTSMRSNTVQAIGRSESHIAECYGLPLPVLVNEALTFSEKNVQVSISCSNNGWAWAVYGRKLFVWQYKDSRTQVGDSSRSTQRRATTAQCRELTLPHSDIGHKASLITVFVTEGQHMASCLAISPTGDLRFWASISHDGSSIDYDGVLDGQEFDYILSIPQGYVLVTTTCSIVLLQLQFASGRPKANYKPLKPPSGFFGGIGRKFASIIIGVNNSNDKENKLIRVQAEKNRDTGDWIMTLLADKWIQRWLFTQFDGEQFLFEDSDIIRKVRDAMFQKGYANKDKDIRIKLLDMQTSDSNVFLLIGVLSNVQPMNMHYFIAIMSESNNQFSVTNFHSLKFSLYYDIGGGGDGCAVQMKFLLNRGIAYLYNENAIYIGNLNSKILSEEIEKITFNGDDRITSASNCAQSPLFFSRKHGFICIVPSEGNLDSSDFLNSTYQSECFGTTSLHNQGNTTAMYPNTTVGNIGLYFLDPEEMCDVNSDVVSQMKAAFIYHIKGNSLKCNGVIRDLLERDDLYHFEAHLDKVISAIAKDLADDIPFADPRWEREELNQKLALGNTASLQILQQLKEKRTALRHFIDFLRLKELWDKLNVVTETGQIKSTHRVLLDICEKIVAAGALKCAQNQPNFKNIVEEAIRVVMEERNQHPTSNLTYQDLFYVKTTKIGDIFTAFLTSCRKYIEHDYQPSKLVKFLHDINTIISIVLTDVLNFRHTNNEVFNIDQSLLGVGEILPWTATPEKGGVSDVFLNLIQITLKHGARVANEIELKQKLYENVVGLVDFILDGKRAFIEACSDDEKRVVLEQQYEKQKRELIFPLVEDQQFELAAKLAEKYHDFQTLVIICDQTDNQLRLDKYTRQFKDYDFGQFAISWHLKENKRVQMFERFKNHKEDLTNFLKCHPSLSWIQYVINSDYKNAAYVLNNLAREETALVSRKKTSLSLAKLSHLAAGDNYDDMNISDINTDLLLIEFQEQLPDNAVCEQNYNPETPRVLTIEEIINVLISDRMGTEIDFRKAIELLNYMKDPYDAKRKIWCAAILKDSWTDYDMNSSLYKLNDMLFFKLLDLCYLSENDPNNYIMDMDSLLNSPELGDLRSNTSFQYLLKLCYEHIADLYSKK